MRKASIEIESQIFWQFGNRATKKTQLILNPKDEECQFIYPLRLDTLESSAL